MADAVVSFAVQRLGDFLIQQAVFLQGVRDEVTWLKDELKMMQCFLKDAAEKEDDDHRIREWVSQVKAVASDTEDVIDTFILTVEGTKRSTNSKGGVLASLKEFSCICNKEIHKGVDLHRIGKDIEGLKKRIVDIKSRRESYGIRNIGDGGDGAGGAIGNLRQLRRTNSYGDEEDVVGFDDITDLLVNELLKVDPQRCLISIFGMGGSGKTTLARKLYHHSKVEGKFECRGWICVSQVYSIRDLLQRVTKSIKLSTEEELEKMTEEDLERNLRRILEGRRYLVVIDDVWKKESWQSLRRAFPDNSNGSRVIVTTRNKVVAEGSDERTYAHKIRHLEPDESWELFSKKAFRNHNVTDGNTQHCLSNLETLGREMVGKCKGLPLAIIVLGGLLSRKQPHEWQRVKEHIWRNLRDDSIHIDPILTLSFNDLPTELKPCFLYLGLFPEDSLIRRERLIHMWIAEGFITPTEKETLEEVAENSFNDLVGRSLIQGATRNWWRIMECRVHDLLRDLAVSKAKELNFLHIYDGNINSTTSSSTASSKHREAVHCLPIERYVDNDNPNSRLRTLSFFKTLDMEPSRSLEPLEYVLTRFRLLRVLDLFDVQFFLRNSKGRTKLPDAVGELIHLRYLGLRTSSIDELPPSIGNLQALQTLDAYTQGIHVRLPRSIKKLKHLRHLIGSFEGLLGVEHLTELQSLIFVHPKDWMRINLRKLTNLRELHIGGPAQGRDPKITLDQIANFRNLHSCRLEIHSVRPPSFEPFSHCPQLTQLFIKGRMEEIPEKMHEYLPNLTCLVLDGCRGFINDPMEALGKLPNLLVLELQKSSHIRKLTITANGFHRVDYFKIISFSNLVELDVEEDAMPMLTAFDLEYSGEPELPERWRPLRNAKATKGFRGDWDWVGSSF